MGAGQGIVALVTNNSFINEITFDGMRKCLEQDFDLIYVLDLGGNVRKNPQLSGTTHNVFGIKVGVSINVFVKKKKKTQNKLVIKYVATDPLWRKEAKYDFLNEKSSIENITWKKLVPDAKHNWLTSGLDNSFDSLIPMGSKQAKNFKELEPGTIFKTFSLGVSTNRDNVVYDFNKPALEKRIQQFCDDYNLEVSRYQQKNRPKNIDDFLDYSHIKWSSTLKNHLKSSSQTEFMPDKICESFYRPFTRMYLYYDHVLVDRPALFKRIFPNSTSEIENRVICINQTSERPFACLVVKLIPNLVFCGGFGAATQCFPLFTYDNDGNNRKENMTDWSLEQFKTQYNDDTIHKLDIFNYIYAVLHHPQYRKKYSANLKRELPHIPFAPVFWPFAKSGKILAELHVNYESQKEFSLKWVEDIEAKVNYRVDRMTFSKDRSSIIYNEFLTLMGIPSEVFEYRLGNRSALEWIIDQYQIKTDKRSGITNDPNNLDDPQYIIRLIGKVITVSLETVKIVKSLPPLF
jgi:predicted helicase